MRRKKKSRAELVSKFTDEALHLSRGAAPIQQRILKIAAALGTDLEPTGRHA